jgi:hypothetical protein
MERSDTHLVPSWRNAQAYRWQRALDRAGFAWEFLRRNRRYRRMSLNTSAAISTGSITASTCPDARVWGLAFR